MSISTQLDRIKSAKLAIKDALEVKGILLDNNATLEDYALSIHNTNVLYVATTLPDNAKEGDLCILTN